MKTRFPGYLMALAAALAGCFLIWLPLTAQNKPAAQNQTAAGKSEMTFSGEIWDSVDAERGSRDQMIKEHPELATPLLCTLFAVRYLSPPAKFVLYDVGSKKIYQLDNQEMAQPYAADRVTITGTYDEANHAIHVTSIKPTH